MKSLFKKITALFLIIMCNNFISVAQTGNSCMDAINLDSLNCQRINLNAPIAQKWFTFTAGTYTTTQYFFVYEDTAAGAPQISAVTILKGTCGSQTIVNTINSAMTNTVIASALTNPVPGTVYTIKVDYTANTATKTTIAICMQSSSSPPPSPQAAAYIPSICPPTNCTLVDENFNYTSSITGAHNSSNPNWGSPFYYGFAPCWGDATGTPQIPNNYAYMWSWRSGPCTTPHNTGEGIYRPLPALIPNNVYVLQYDYSNPGTTTLDELHVLITPSGSNNWPLGINANINTIATKIPLDMPTAVAPAAFATRQVCFQVPASGTFNNSDLVFYPWSTTCGNHSFLENLYIDNVKLYNIDPTISLAYTGGGCHASCAQLSTCPLPAGLVTYAWVPTSGLSCSTCPNPIACPTVTTTYTVTMTVVGNNTVVPTCPSVTAAITVTAGCQGAALTTGTMPVGTTAVSGNNTLTGSIIIPSGSVYNINGAIIGISPNVVITVNNGGILNITNSNLYACSDMWQGIVVDPGGTVRVTSSLVEDAIIAIDNSNLNGGSVGYTTPISVIRVTGSVFNCNRTGIKQSFFQSTTSSDYSTSYFSVDNSVFTCRCGISFSSISAGSLAQLNTYNGILANPSLNDFYSVANLQLANLKTPYLGIPPLEGINFQDDGPLSNTSPATFAYNVGGAAGVTIFDNHTYGINAINASFSVTASAFQVPRQIGGTGHAPPTVGGYGINALNNATNFYNGIYVNNSSFIRMIGGIKNINYFDIDLNTNTLFSLQILTPFGVVSISPLEGSFGMYSKTPRFTNANMSANNIANINTCIDFVIDANSTYNSTNNNEAVGPVTVNKNTIGDQFATNPVARTGTYIGNAIVVDNVLAASVGASNVTSGAGTKILIEGNTITNALNGILARNHQWQQLRDESNIITMLYQPTNYTTETQQYGIEHDHDIYINLTGHYNDIYKNTVTGFSSGYSTATQPKFEPKKGIWSRYCAQHWDVCNTVINAGRGFEFEGAHSGITWWLNTMNTCGEAYTLSNGGIIGAQQPVPCSGCTVPDAQDNQWPNGNFIETMCDLSNAGSSILYVQNVSPPYKPTLNSQSGGFAYTGATLLTANGPNQYNCASSPPPALRNSGNNRTANTSSDQKQFFEKIVQDSMHYVSYVTENSIINKNMVYAALQQDTSLIGSSTILQNFYSGSNTGSRGALSKTEDALHSRNYNYATSLINSFTPANIIEQNYKRFYQIYIHVQQGACTASDSSDLETLAASCPMLNGMVVFQARAFHNSMYNGFKHYNDNCPTGVSNRENQNEPIITNQKASLSFYPNPTTGMVYVSGTAGTNYSYSAEVYDISGKLIYKNDLLLENGTGKFKLDAQNGMYMLYLYGGDTKNGSVYKIMINK